MRFFAIHDPSGNIFSLVGSPSTGPVMKPTMTAQSQFFSEVKLPPRLFDPAKPATYQRLTEIAGSYVIEMPLSKPGKLVKKDKGEPQNRGTLRSLTITPNSITRPQVPRFDVTLKERAAAAGVHVSIVLDPSPGDAPIMLLGSISIPPGETTMTLSLPLPASVSPGTHVVSAMVGPEDSVTAKLTVKT
jgi:hypothetical protein